MKAICTKVDLLGQVGLKKVAQAIVKFSTLTAIASSQEPGPDPDFKKIKVFWLGALSLVTISTKRNA